MSHNHPFIDAKYIHKGGLYGLRDHPVKGESSVNVAGPDSVHVKHLSHIYRMSDHHFNALKTAIQKNCPEALKRRGDSDKTKLDPCNRSSIATHAIEIFSTTGTRNRRKQLKNNRQTGKNRQHSPQNGHGAPHNSHTSGPSSQPYHAAPGPSSHQGNGGGGSSSNDKRKH
ncbi:hypothetical protein B0H34DRAFT_474989 [Crassisporium funariophilum]|nr:hypothetical protein B0H34DRAFT_474989 [Crassisporium funariophilum]